MKAEIKVRVAPEMMESVRALAKLRGQSMSEYIARATRNQLMADGAGMEADTIRKRIMDANAPLNRSANFAAIHAAATMAFMREWSRETFVRQGLPDELARKKSELLHEAALDEALAAFEDPRNLHQFGWIERPESEADLPAWLTDEDE